MRTTPNGYQGAVMATYAASKQFREDLSDEDRAGAQRAVEGTMTMLQRQADERAAVRAERARTLTTVVGDTRPAAGDGVELRDAVRRIREGLSTSRDDARTRPVEAFNVRLHPGLTVTSAPYDVEWHWTAPGNTDPDVSIADRNSGAMHILGDSGDEPLNAACGVGMAVRSDVRTIVQVRPLITCEWRYTNSADIAFGAFAESEGGVNLAAWRDGICVSVGCVRSARLFRNRASAGELGHDVGAETVLASDIQIEFTAEPGVTTWVNAGAWLWADHSSGASIFGSSAGSGAVDARVVFVVMERFLPS